MLKYKKIVSMVEAPDGVSAVFFFNRCNMGCSYCYNKDLFTDKGLKDIKHIYEDIDNLKKYNKELDKYFYEVDYVILSGGEALESPTYSEKILKYVKKYHPKLKTGVYTNGTRFLDLSCFLKIGLLDYVSIDVKCILDNDLDSNNYFKFPIEKYKEKLSESLKCLNKSNILYTIRTCIDKKALQKSTLENLIKFINLSDNHDEWIIRPFLNLEDKNYDGFLSAKDFRKLLKESNITKNYIKNKKIRFIGDYDGINKKK